MKTHTCRLLKCDSLLYRQKSFIRKKLGRPGSVLIAETFDNVFRMYQLLWEYSGQIETEQVEYELSIMAHRHYLFLVKLTSRVREAFQNWQNELNALPANANMRDYNIQGRKYRDIESIEDFDFGLNAAVPKCRVNPTERKLPLVLPLTSRVAYIISSVRTSGAFIYETLKPLMSENQDVEQFLMELNLELSCTLYSLEIAVKEQDEKIKILQALKDEGSFQDDLHL